ncbi:MAG: sigma-70 family RNA polymerase sigma factor [Elusimicrobiaceae bacterium]|nr:sigma-70 family RNA polymerase sigma factor [Elusimicrobiaceae bacterium]MBR3604149.1 sigma-70 family RNA polymerase sigma factor [Elusimicrobiaceae bacterium]
MNFDEVYNRLFKAVLAYVRGRLNCQQSAEEVCSLIWQKAWDKQEQFNPEKGIVDQWIFGIARNEVNKYFTIWRIKRFFSLAEEEENLVSADPTPFEIMEQTEKNAMLLQAFSRLNPRERDLISLKYFAHFNNRQIAQMSGLSESNVGTILNRAIQKLRVYMEAL